ncbi:MAG: PHP domain-containing protein [Bacillota bacterium]
MSTRTGLVDLHLHSTASDGVCPPARVVTLAAAAGLAAVALTDHETLSGLAEAAAAGERCGIEVVPGLEISAREQETEIHILGYYPTNYGDLENILGDLRRERITRMEAMLARLSRAGLHISLEAVLEEASPGAPGRLHLARLMRKQKMVNSLEQAFTGYLEQGKPAYVPRRTLNPLQALELLSICGAVPVLAHPGQRGAVFLDTLAAAGLQGVEVFHPDHGNKLRDYYTNRAHKLNLLITGGSDFHGDADYCKRQPGSVAIAYDYLARLKERRR